LARLLGGAKRYSESLGEYRRVLRDKPDLLAAQVEMAQVLYWSGQHAEALDILRAVPRERLDPEARLALIELLVVQKQYPQAEQLLREHLAQSPEDLRARLKLAEVLSWDQRYEASLEQYRSILQARPDDVQVRRKYALVLGWAGQRDLAIQELRKTLPGGGQPSKP
jgi:thioredoxin-like negative regulator of GroEL